MKLQARIASYLDQEMIQPVVRSTKQDRTHFSGAAVVLVLTIGLFVYNQQTVRQTTDITTEPATVTQQLPYLTDIQIMWGLKPILHAGPRQDSKKL